MGFWDAVASAGPHANNLNLAADIQPHQHFITSFFTGQMLFLMSNQQCQSTEGNMCTVWVGCMCVWQATRWRTQCTLSTVKMSQCSLRSSKVHVMQLATQSALPLNQCREPFWPTQGSSYVVYIAVYQCFSLKANLNEQLVVCALRSYQTRWHRHTPLFFVHSDIDIHHCSNKKVPFYIWLHCEAEKKEPLFF